MRDLRGARIAVLAPIAWPAPPNGYGPWEQIAYDIAEGLVDRGIDVTLFATQNSRTRAKLDYVVPVGINEDARLDDGVYSALHIANAFRRHRTFDLIHNNFDWRPLTYAMASTAPPLVTTIHGFSSPAVLAAYYAGASRSFYCSISDADRDPGLEYLATVYNGLDPSAFEFVPHAQDYVCFLGRFHPEKGAHVAIEAARRAGTRIVLAGIPHDVTYFETMVRPHIDGDRVVFLGPVEREARQALLGNARALVHMTTRPERFGLTMIEAMACGTPVVGARMGSIPEVVADGVTGILCDSVDAAADAIAHVGALDRVACRRRVEAHFTRELMVDRYIDAYARALEEGTPRAPKPRIAAAREKDYWERPMGFTDLPARPRIAPDLRRLLGW